MKPVHPDGFTNISYIQSSWYGHTKPFTVKRRQKPQYLSVCDSSEPNWKNFCCKRHAANAWETKAT